MEWTRKERVFAAFIVLKSGQQDRFKVARALENRTATDQLGTREVPKPPWAAVSCLWKESGTDTTWLARIINMIMNTAAPSLPPEMRTGPRITSILVLFNPDCSFQFGFSRGCQKTQIRADRKTNHLSQFPPTFPKMYLSFS